MAIARVNPISEGFNKDSYLANLERRLEDHAEHKRISLLLPSLYSEIRDDGPLNQILAEISETRYLHNIVVALGGTTEEADFLYAKEYFGQLRTDVCDVKVVWVEGPRIQQILDDIQQFMTLEDDDIIMTGTPKGVGQVQVGDRFVGRIKTRDQELVSQEWLAEERT